MLGLPFASSSVKPIPTSSGPAVRRQVDPVQHLIAPAALDFRQVASLLHSLPIETFSLRNACHHCGLSAITNLNLPASAVKHVMLLAYSIAFIVASGIGSPGLQRADMESTPAREAPNVHRADTFRASVPYMAGADSEEFTLAGFANRRNSGQSGPSTACR